MNVRRFFSALALLIFATSMSLKAEQPKTIETINRFLESIEKNDSLDAALKKEVVTSVTQLRDDQFSADAAITEGLMLMYPEFTKALELVGNDEVDKAIEAFQKLTSHENKFLAAEAKYFIARA